MLRVVKSELAELDLLKIWIYTTEEWNLSQADSYLAQLGKTLNNLTDYPGVGKDKAELRKRLQITSDQSSSCLPPLNW